MSDELRERLQRLDPLAGASTPHPTGHRARELLEDIMATDPNETTPTAEAPRSRAPMLAVAAVVVLLAAVLGALALGGGDDDVETASPGTTAPVTSDDAPLLLSLPDAGGGPSISSCMMFDVAILADMSPAFAGTVVEDRGDAIVLDVDRWYAGGDAATVELAVRTEGTASIDGVDFEVGERYLVTAAEGTVNGCGYSGLATAELEAAFDEAFGAA